MENEKDPMLDIRIGTLVDGKRSPEKYIEQILEHGFESFQLTFWQNLGDADLQNLARRVHSVLSGTGAVISSLGIYGNPLETGVEDRNTREAWSELIKACPHFGCDVVAGFAGRIRGVPIDQSISRFGEVFGPVAKQAEAAGVRLAFENCDMEGDWNRGDWNIAHNPRAWELMFNEVVSDFVGLEWEPCHQMIRLIDPIPQLRDWVGKIFHIHGKCASVHWDVVRKSGVHSGIPYAHHRTPGFGDCNWTDVISELRRGGFTGAIDIEGWHDPVYRDDLEMTGQVHALNYLKRCRGGAFVPNPVID